VKGRFRAAWVGGRHRGGRRAAQAEALEGQIDAAFANPSRRPRPAARLAEMAG